VVAVLTVLSLGLGALLLLNTLLAQGSFALHSLEAQVSELADREQALRQKVAELAAPGRLERRARALGMVPSANPAFLRARDGKVLGVPMPATGPAPVVGSTTTEPDEAAPDEGQGATGQQDQQDEKQAQEKQSQEQGQQQEKRSQEQGQQQDQQQDGEGTDR
jgi:hypothetical protein